MIARVFKQNAPAFIAGPVNGLVLKSGLFRLEGWAALILVAAIIGYLIFLGRNGGTVFQRLLGMKRVSEPVIASGNRALGDDFERDDPSLDEIAVRIDLVFP